MRGTPWHLQSCWPLVVIALACSGGGDPDTAGPGVSDDTGEPTGDDTAEESPPGGRVPVWEELGESDPVGPAPQDCAGPLNGPLEVCNDLVDNNCDGSADPCVWDGLVLLEEQGLTLTGETQGTRTGIEVQAVGDIDGDGHRDVAVGAGAFTRDAAGDGMVYLERGPFQADRIIGGRSIKIWGEAAGDNLGKTVAPEVDYDGDGYTDLVLGCSVCDGVNGTDSGRVYLLSGPLTASTSVSAADVRLDGRSPNDYSGRSVVDAGDLDGDGNIDLLIGSNGVGGGYGSLYLLNGPFTHDSTVADAVLQIQGHAKQEWVGTFNVVLGDTDGDGISEIATAGYQYGPTKWGAASILSADDRGVLSTLDHPDMVLGTRTWTGRCLEAPGDLDGDGLADMVIGSPRAPTEAGNDTGMVYLMAGPFTGQRTVDEAFATISGTYSDQWFGEQARGRHDLDGDGTTELVVSSRPGWSHGNGGPGEVYIFEWPETGAHSASDAKVTILGAYPKEADGGSLEIDHLDGDPYPDLILGRDPDFSGTTGGAWILWGLGL